MFLKVCKYVRYFDKIFYKIELKCLLKYSCNCRNYKGYLIFKIFEDNILRMQLRLQSKNKKYLYLKSKYVYIQI